MNNLTRLDPINELLKGFLIKPFASELKLNDFKVDLIENEQALVVHAELPGIEKNNIDVNLDKSILTISAIRENKFEKTEKNQLYQERSYGKVLRSFNLGPNIDQENVKAVYNDGVLSITISKKFTDQQKKILIE